MLTARPQERSGLWVAFRQTDVDPHTPVFWRAGSAGRPNVQESARWHTKGKGFAQYMALTPDGAWAEFVRAREIASAAEAAMTLRHLWRCWVVETAIADLRTPALADACGIEATLLIGDHRPCRDLADELVAMGFRGVLSPNAALEGHVNLTLFGPRDENHLLLGDSFDPRYASQDVVDVRIEKSGAHPQPRLIAHTRAKDADPATYMTWPGAHDGLPVALA